MASLMREIGFTDTGTANGGKDDWKIEVVVMPVSDIDRAKEFYIKLGWRPDQILPGFVQLTLPGSTCSLQLGAELSTDAPGSRKGYIIVSDIESARKAMIAAGIQVGQIFHIGPRGPVGGRDPERRTYRSLALFSDPDGNSWVLQENTSRLPARRDAGVTSFNFATGFRGPLFDAVAAGHGQDKLRIGQADEIWPDWYAEYMTREQGGAALPM